MLNRKKQFKYWYCRKEEEAEVDKGIFQIQSYQVWRWNCCGMSVSNHYYHQLVLHAVPTDEEHLLFQDEMMRYRDLLKGIFQARGKTKNMAHSNAMAKRSHCSK